jgi:hypothetical protein
MARRLPSPPMRSSRCPQPELPLASLLTDQCYAEHARSTPRLLISTAQTGRAIDSPKFGARCCPNAARLGHASG